ncbi:G-type lectin S-receptor-like serine/threonine-protein kinase At1g61550 isoform X2 [Eucalyptus grandis]|uniref:G-type lectin S-receptor-like serine/threonine-protein kinase At1g61550 isoform X2 n=1 Tax=Eucalyptus grandis TaxID=71139 RepID=UPI00192ED6E2|nr:G-type lectin S-receptor-like serine/threonine-protein kinase At1g61550 isoform X2 [Eucalyptus grandis]
MSSCFTISLSLLFFFINFVGTESAPTFLRHYCPNTTLFTPNSAYQSNLNTLLSSLASAAADGADGFANATVGQNHPDQVYGLFFCRGDINTSTCGDCVATGKQDILQRCPNQRVSVIWYDECMLRYSDGSIYSVMEQVPSFKTYRTRNITNPTQFMLVLGETMDDIAARASVGKSGKKLAVAEANFTSSQKLYTLAQCTPDLTVLECNTCLQARIGGLPQGKQGGRLFAPSCSMRFELYPFYNASAMAALVPPPSYLRSPHAPVTRRKALQSSTIYSITASSPLAQDQTLVSSSQIFELRFFTPKGSAKQYVGIWYKQMTPSRVVWVANRDKPLGHTDQSASLIIGEDGNLKLLDGRQNTVWSTNAMAKSNYSEALLSDYGNFVLQDRNAHIMWESFDEPIDTLLPNMKIGVNVKEGKKLNLTSWKGEDDPSHGSFVAGVTSETPPQLFIWNGSSPYWRSGHWDKTKFIGVPNITNIFYDLQQDNVQGTSYYYLKNYNNSIFEYVFISSEGSLKAAYWFNGWITYWEVPAPTNPCDIYGICGPFGVCNPFSSPICRCLKGFKPRSDEEWNRGNWTRGCLRKMELNCQKSASAAASTTVEKDMFRQMRQIKLPDSADHLLIDNAEGCQSWCLENCSCLAFSYVNAIGCMAWSKDLLDTQQLSMGGEDLFIRLVYASAGMDTGVPTRTKLIIGLSTISGIILFGASISVCGLSKWRGKFRKMKIPRLFTSEKLLRDTTWKDQMKEDDTSKLVVYDFDSIRLATDNFNVKNKLGQGGFGPVYKGKLNDGKEIAAKRLSSSSGQGIAEFKNEILLISKLQHRNLVRLFGCCIEGEEKILVYEYLPNKSLDTFLFDSKEKAKLSWSVRFHIIQGVAKGLLYLHRDSCLRVIHRDLKVSNILLDEKMNPKISDFGLSRMFEGTQVLVNTHKIVGTLGYMSPEYAMGGIFSEKSDVYSFGVLLLEIISGKKNTSLDYPGQHLNLLTYAWHLWCEDKGLDLMDEGIADAFLVSEVMRCIQLGLLCTQDHATDRPNMFAVVLMLNGESNLSQPKQPTYTFSRSPAHEVPSQEESIRSVNTITISTVEGR